MAARSCLESGQSSSPQHFLVLDVYRFAAAAGVMLSHYLLVADLRTGAGYGWVVAHFHLLVDFFFILSGFVIALHYDGRILSARDYGHYIQRRLARIYPLHALTLLVTLVIFFAGIWAGLPVRDAARFEMSALPAHLTLTHAFGVTRALTFNVPSWSLSAEFFVYLLFPLLALIARRGIVFAAGCAAIFIAAFIAVRHGLGLGHWTKADFDLGAFRAVPSFLGGIVIARYVRDQAGPALAWPLIGLCAAACVALLFAPVPDVWTILCLGFLVFLTARAEQQSPLAAWLQPLFQKLGAWSYGVYLWHIIVGTIIITGGVRFMAETVQSYALLSLAAMVVTVIVAGLGYRYFERPAQKFLQGQPQVRIGNVARR